MVDLLEIIIRVILSFDLAVGVGLERQLGRKPAGFGTFTFVATASTVIGVMATDLMPENPTPLLGGAITGVGFLGAGALIRSQDRVFGFTTAALIWAMASLGLAVGVGLYSLALSFYAVIWFIILVDRLLERRGFGSHARILDITFASPIELKDVRAFLPPEATFYDKVSLDKETGLTRVRASLRVRQSDADRLYSRLQSDEKVKSVSME